jgi:CheY-like chemotaxis protein
MKSLRVLVIEDDTLIAMLLAELLAGMGHDVCATVATQAQAVAAAGQHRPDLMLVDESLRRGNGVSAVEEILRAGPIAHVFVSGNARRIQTLMPGAVVIQKPFREAELVSAIEVAIDASVAGKMDQSRSSLKPT